MIKNFQFFRFLIFQIFYFLHFPFLINLIFAVYTKKSSFSKRINQFFSKTCQQQFLFKTQKFNVVRNFILHCKTWFKIFWFLIFNFYYCQFFIFRKLDSRDLTEKWNFSIARTNSFSKISRFSLPFSHSLQKKKIIEKTCEEWIDNFQFHK